MPDVTADTITAKTLTVGTVGTVGRPRRRRRWWLRLPLIALAMIVVTVVLAQVFLWTDYPRQIAEAQVQRILNVRTSIRAVSIGWLGRTRIEGVALTLPMESEPFLTIDSIDARHASLPLIAFTQDLRDVAVRGVSLVARQDAAGRWNLRQLEPAPSSSASTPAAQPRSANPLADVPSFHANDVRVALVRADGTRLDVKDITADLTRRDALTADVSASVGETIRVDGRLSLLAAMPHELRLRAGEVPAEVASFFDVTPPSPLALDARWDGRRTGDGVAGVLQIAKVVAGRLSASGRVDVEAGGAGGVTFRPSGLAGSLAGESPTAAALVDVAVEGGAITYDGAVRVERLHGTLNGGRFALDGTADPATLASDVALDWQQVARDALTTSGTARVTTSRLFNGKLKVDMAARGGARVAAGSGEGAITVSGEGDAIDLFAVRLNIDPFTWTPAAAGAEPIVVPRLEGNLVAAGESIRLDARSPEGAPTGALSAFAGIDRKSSEWWATFDASALQLPALESRGVRGPFDASLAASGTASFIDVRKAYAKFGRATVYATGVYEVPPAVATLTTMPSAALTTAPATAPAAPRPLRLSTWAWYDKPVTEDNAAQLNSLTAVGTVWGTLAPTALEADVNVSGSELVVAGRRVGDVALHVRGEATDEAASLYSEELRALGGEWSLRGRWSKAQGWPPVVVARFRDVPVSELGAALGRDDLGGTIDAGEATVLLRSSRLDQIEMTATARGSTLSAGPFRAESLDLVATLRSGAFEVTPTLRESGGTIATRVRGTTDLKRPIRASVTLEDWPAPYVTSTAVGAERFRPRASGRANAEISLETGDVTADVAIGGVVERGDAKLADFRLEADVKGKQITLTRATIDTLDGRLAATGRFDLADLNASVLHATFDNLTPARLAWSNPILGEVGGRLDGSFTIRPSAGIRPLGPLEVELNVRPDDVSFRNVAVGDVDVLAFADVAALDAFRFVTERAVLNVAGGRVEPFLRLTADPSNGLSQLVTVNFGELDMGQLARAADDDGKEIVGRLGGRLQLYGRTADLASLTGDARLEISRSDLANFGPISALYNALSVGTAGTEPNGEGTVLLRVGGGVVTLDDATYFNRGVYANGFGTVRDVDEWPAASLDLIVFGSLQPLRAVKLPFFGDLNDTLAALQSSITAIEVTGVPKEPTLRQVAIGGIGDTFQKVLLGKMKERN